MKGSGTLRLADRMVGRDNNLNLLRLIAALSVLLSHAYPIALGEGTPEPLLALTGNGLGGHAVTVFFILSGLLIAASFENSRTVWHWGMARLFRLFPGLLGVLLLTVLVLGPLVTTLPVADYFGRSETWRYVITNFRLFGMQYALPGVFETNPYGPPINGSLWSLPFEVECYALLGIAGLLGVLRRPWMAILFVALVLFIQIAPLLEGASPLLQQVHAKIIVQPGSAFGLGSSAYVLRRWLRLDGRIVLFAAALVVFSHGTPFFAASLLFTVAYALLWIAYVPRGAILGFNRLGDYSYGVYLYAFPVQQLVAWSFPGLGLAPSVAIALPATAIMAFASWHLLEKHAMAIGKRAANALVAVMPDRLANLRGL